MSDVAEWHIARGEKQSGPVPWVKLREYAAAGRLRPTDLLWKEGMADWQAAGSLPGLFAAAPASPPPVPPSMPRQTPPPPMPFAQPRPAAPAEDIGQNAGVRMLLPVGRSGWAIAAGYLGLLSLIPIFAPFALATGVLAVLDMKKHPERHGMGRAIFGLVMGSLFSLALGVMLVAVLMSK